MKALVFPTVLLLSWSFSTSPCLTQTQSLIPFELEDQFHDTHRRGDYLGHPIVLFGTDRAGSRYSGLWAIALSSRLKDHELFDELVALSTPDLSGLPRFLRGFVRNQFPEDPDRWVLMDWTGLFASSYDFAPEVCNIMVFARSGEVLHQIQVQEVDPATLDRLVTKLKEALDRV